MESLQSGGISWLQVVFWVVFPDLVAFSAIGAFSKRNEWPSWGSDLYNVWHTILVSGATFVVLSVALGSVYWPLLGWLGHIAVGCAVGCGLRTGPKKVAQV